MRYIFFTVLFTSISGLIRAADIRIEPQSWWTNMKLNELQIMLHGNKLAELSPRLDQPGIEITEVHRVESKNYLFVDILISAEAKPGSYQFILEGKDSKAQKVAFELIERERDGGDLIGFNSSDFIYLITPDRFANGNRRNDNVKGMKELANRDDPGGRHGGDLEGLANNLNYIADMGFTAVWINPLLENDMEKFSYHGYSTTDFYKVDPRFGSNEDYKELVDQASEKGLKVIMDMIANHCGSEHWWMDDLPSYDWLNQWNSYTQTSHRKTTILDPYASLIDKDTYEKGWFVKTMPDLNQANPMVATYLIQNSIWWVEYLGLSGIRMDTYSYSDANFLANWTRAVMTEYPNFNIVGEEWFAEPTLVSYWQRDKINDNGYTSHLRSLCDFPMVFAVVEALNAEESFGEGLIQIYELLGHDYLYPHPEDLLIFPDNHDMSRIYTQLNEDYDLYKMALAFYATTRGIPMMYYGTEILMANPGTDAHGVIRSDFPGGWTGDETSAFSGKGLSPDQKAAQEYVKQLLNWRKNSEAITLGSLMHYEPVNGVYVYFRYTENDKVMVVLNKNEGTIELGLDRFDEMLEGISSGSDIITGKQYDLQDTLVAEGRSASIIQL